MLKNSIPTNPVNLMLENCTVTRVHFCELKFSSGPGSLCLHHQ